ncbi:MAG: hypothetical protein HOI09_07405, partial [Porticoccaceae bacterium]|nr:hypothetical protein [Porticoccaceae bacterium]
GDHTGSYTLSVQNWADTDDDFLANEFTTSVVTAGGSVAGEIESAGDKDWHAISLLAGETYVIDLKGADGDWGTLADPVLQYIYDASGWFISGTSDRNSGFGENSSVEFRSEASGTFYISAAGEDDTTGTYTLSVQNWEDTGDDFRASEFTTSFVTVGGSVIGEIERSDDRDWHAVSLVAGEIYVIDLKGADGDWGTLADPYLDYIYDASGSRISETSDNNSGAGKNGYLEFRPEASGTYYINAAGSSDKTGTYTLSVQNWANTGDDVLANELTASTVLVGGSVTGEIESSRDTDWHAVSLEQDQLYAIDLKGFDSDGGSLGDGYLSLRDHSGNHLSTGFADYAGTRDGRIEFIAPETGTYFAVAHGQNSSIGTYKLSIETIDAFSSVDESSAASTAGERLDTLKEVGPSTNRVDIIFIGDGFTAGEQNDVRNHVDRLTEEMLGYEPLARYEDYFNIHIINLVSEESGIDDLPDVMVDTALDAGTSFNEFHGYKVVGIDGQLANLEFSTSENFGIDPDIKTVIVNKTGTGGTGGGIVVTEPNAGILVHEVGHSFVGLSDEYYYDGRAYEGVDVNRRINVSDEPLGLQWSHWLGYNDPYTGVVSAFEGAGYYETGLFRPSQNSKMKSFPYFDPIGKEAFIHAIYEDVDPIDYHTAAGSTLVDPNTVFVDLIGNIINVEWSINGVLIDDNSPLYSYIEVHEDRQTLDISKLSLSNGLYEISARAFDPTDMVRVDRSDLEQTVVWNCSITNSSEDQAADDFTQDRNTSSLITIGDTTDAAIDFIGDQDWHEVSLSAGQLYQISLTGLDGSSGTLPDPKIVGIYNNSGTLIPWSGNNDFDGSHDSQVEFLADATETYFVSVGSNTTDTGSYSIQVVPINRSSDDFAESPLTPSLIDLGTSVEGMIGVVGDVDWHGVALSAGQRYQFKLSGKSASSGALNKPEFVGVYTQAGERIDYLSAVAAGSSDRSQLDFYAPETGTYYIAAGAADGDTGSYEITSNTAERVLAYSTVEVGGSVTGEIESSGTQDLHAVSLLVGETYVIDLKGADGDWGTLADPYLAAIYDASGSSISGTYDNNSGSGKNSFLEFRPEASGTYYINATGEGDHTGTYTLSVQTFADSGDDYLASELTTSVVTVGGSVTGEIESSGDEDWHAVSLVAGETYLIDLKGADGNWGTLADPVLWFVYDPSGAHIGYTADNDSGTGKNSSLEFIPEASGTYYINATGYDDSIGTYTLSVEGPAVNNNLEQAIKASVLSANENYSIGYEVDGLARKLSADQSLTFVTNDTESTTVPIVNATLGNILTDITFTHVVLENQNYDKGISLSDAILQLEHIVNINILTGANAIAADVSGDGNISLSDAIMTLEHIVNISHIDTC